MIELILNILNSCFNVRVDFVSCEVTQLQRFNSLRHKRKVELVKEGSKGSSLEGQPPLYVEVMPKGLPLRVVNQSRHV